MQRSQRTGFATCSIMRFKIRSPESRIAPSLFETRPTFASWTTRLVANLLNPSRAGFIKSVWNAPETCNDRTRAPSGAKVESARKSPAATICPPPLSFAATSPASAIACKTSSRTPPNTALIPDSLPMAAFAISTPRVRTRRSASTSEKTPAIAAAVISPTECPAINEKSLSAPIARALSKPAATISGWALAVSRISSASACVPR